jgi:hypothetical protein
MIATNSTPQRWACAMPDSFRDPLAECLRPAVHRSCDACLDHIITNRPVASCGERHHIDLPVVAHPSRAEKDASVPRPVALHTADASSPCRKSAARPPSPSRRTSRRLTAPTHQTRRRHRSPEVRHRAPPFCMVATTPLLAHARVASVRIVAPQPARRPAPPPSMVFTFSRRYPVGAPTAMANRAN